MIIGNEVLEMESGNIKELSIDEVSKILGLSKNYIQKLIGQGKLEAVYHIRYGKGGGRVRMITATSVAKYCLKMVEESEV